MDINKVHKSKNIRHNIKFTFPHETKRLQKENMFEPCDFICHETVAFYTYRVIGALTLHECYITRCTLTSATIFMYSTNHKNIKKAGKISKIS
jgi:hypothetical protein